MMRKISNSKRSIPYMKIIIGLAVIGFLFGFYNDVKRIPCPCICCKYRILSGFGTLYNYGKLFFIYLLKRPGCLFKKTILGALAFLTLVTDFVLNWIWTPFMKGYRYVVNPIVWVFRQINFYCRIIFDKVLFIFLPPLSLLKGIFGPLNWAIKYTAPSPNFNCSDITYWRQSFECAAKKTHWLFQYPFSGITTVAEDIDWAIDYILERYRKKEVVVVVPEEPVCIQTPEPTPRPPKRYCGPKDFLTELRRKLDELSEKTGALYEAVPDQTQT